MKERPEQPPTNEQALPRHSRWSAARSTRVFIGMALSVLILAIAWVCHDRWAGKPRSAAEALAADLALADPWFDRWLQASHLWYRLVPDQLEWPLRDRASRAVNELHQRKLSAATKLRAMGTNAWPFVPVLIESLRGDDYNNVTAVDALARIRADEHPDWPRLAKRLEGNRKAAFAFNYLLNAFVLSNHPFVAQDERFALIGLAATGQAGSEHISSVRWKLKEMQLLVEDEPTLWDPDLLRLAVLALNRMGAEQDHVPGLMNLLKDPQNDPRARAAASAALAVAVPEPAGMRQLLRQMLGDPSATVRLASAKALWERESDTAEVLPTLGDLINCNLVPVRKGALRRLAEMGAAALPLRPEIERLAQEDPDETVRAAANAALKAPGLESPRPGNGK